MKLFKFSLILTLMLNTLSAALFSQDTLSSFFYPQDTITLPAEDFYLKVKLSERKVYVGQQILFSVEMYSSSYFSRYSRDESVLNDKKIEFKRNKGRKNESVTVNENGKIYQWTVIDDYAIYPLASGKFKVPSIEYTITLKDSPNRVKFKTLILHTPESEEFEALPLPDDFEANVDGFDIFNMKIAAIEKGENEHEVSVSMESLAHEFFIPEPDLDIDGFAKVELVAVKNESHFLHWGKQINQRTFVYIIKLYKEGVFNLSPTIKTYGNDYRMRIGKDIEIKSNVPFEKENVKEKKLKMPFSQTDIIIVLDLSSSMLAQDFDSSRFGFCKNKIEVFCSQIKENQRIGLIGFAGEPFVFQELTRDMKLLSQKLKTISAGTLQVGTGTGNAIMLAIEQLKNSTAPEKRILVLTDDKPNCGYFDLKVALAVAADMDIQVSILGINSNQEALIPVTRKRTGEFNYKKRKTNFDVKYFENLMEDRGFFSRIENPEEFEEAFEQSLSWENKSIKEESEFSLKVQAIFMENARLLYKGVKLREF